MTKERYKQIIDDTYKNYRLAFVEGHIHQELDKCLTQEEFINEIKTDDEFAKMWFNTQRWVWMCSTRFIWGLNYQHNIFKIKKMNMDKEYVKDIFEHEEYNNN
jgi:hypothetical protein